MFDVYKWSQYVIMDVMRKLCLPAERQQMTVITDTVS